MLVGGLDVYYSWTPWQADVVRGFGVTFFESTEDEDAAVASIVISILLLL